ncbi:hypothetical protein E2320_020720, partial [Naja naja]
MLFLYYYFSNSATRVRSRLANLQMDCEPLDEGYMEHFFKSLTKLRNLRVLRLEKLHFTESCSGLLVEVFRTNQKLKELNLILEDTNDIAMKLLFQASRAAMIKYCSSHLAEVFRTNQTLKELKLYLDNIDDR